MALVSVVIPCRNEVAYIADCVNAIYASDYKNIEVLVVDGMSDDGTRDELKRLQSQYSNLKVVDNPEQLTPYAFNYGVKAATGEYVQIVGSRNILANDYLSMLQSKLAENPEIHCVGGDYQHVFDTPMAKYTSLAMESKFGVGASNYRTKGEDGFVDTVGVPMYRQSIFDKIGYFDERLTRNQDDDFNFRLTKSGGKIFYLHSAKTTYCVRGSLGKLFRQYFQYGYFKVFVNKKHGTVTTKRQLVPALFVGFLLASPALTSLWPNWSLIFSMVMFAYFALGFLYGSPKAGSVVDRLLVQTAILTMHLGYGFGYLKGIVDFLLLRRGPSERQQVQTT